MQKILKTLLMPLLFTGCAQTTLVKSPPSEAGKMVTLTHHVALWGWWEVSPPVAIHEKCGPAPWTEIKTVYSPANMLVGILTLGSYTPITVQISCQNLQSRR